MAVLVVRAPAEERQLEKRGKEVIGAELKRCFLAEGPGETGGYEVPAKFKEDLYGILRHHDRRDKRRAGKKQRRYQRQKRKQ